MMNEFIVYFSNITFRNIIGEPEWDLTSAMLAHEKNKSRCIDADELTWKKYDSNVLPPIGIHGALIKASAISEVWFVFPFIFCLILSRNIFSSSLLYLYIKQVDYPWNADQCYYKHFK